MDLKARNNMTDEKKVPEWVGTVSHATMRWEDLIPAFTDFLHEIWRGEVFTKEECPDQHLAGKTADRFYGDLNEIVGDLFDAIEEYVPEGYYFGAHPGDGSDYGIWPVEEEDE